MATVSWNRWHPSLETQVSLSEVFTFEVALITITRLFCEVMAAIYIVVKVWIKKHVAVEQMVNLCIR